MLHKAAKFTRFRLRTMLLLVTFAAVAFPALDRIRENAQARMVIAKYRTERLGIPPSPAVAGWLPSSISRLFWPRAADTPVNIRTPGHIVTDRDMAELAVLRDIRELIVYQNTITDRGVSSLGACPMLKLLAINSAGITDASLQRIVAFDSVRSLDLSDCKITDAGLRPLIGMKRLASLSLSGCAITDAGIGVLANIKSLWSLGLSRTLITDGAVEPLSKFFGLCYVDVEGTRFSQAGRDALQKASPFVEVLPPVGGWDDYYERSLRNR